jgi:hypothetical protein
MGFFTNLAAVFIGDRLRRRASFLSDTVGCFCSGVAVDFDLINDL